MSSKTKKAFTPKTPEDFETYLEWKKPIGNFSTLDIDIATKEQQKLYIELEGDISREYQNHTGDLDRLEHLENRFENCKKEIKRLKKERQDLKQKEADAKAKKEKQFQAFLMEVVESGYLQELAKEYKNAFDNALMFQDMLDHWGESPHVFQSLGIFPQSQLGYFPDEMELATQQMLTRFNNIREVKK